MVGRLALLLAAAVIAGGCDSTNDTARSATTSPLPASTVAPTSNSSPSETANVAPSSTALTTVPGPTTPFDSVDSSACDDLVNPHGQGCTVPDWFADRVPLPLCGIEIRAIHPDERACFRYAAAAGGPAEIVVTDLIEDYGLSTVQWFRSLGTGRGFEVIERTQYSEMIMPDEPGVASYVEVGPWEWHRYACDRIKFSAEDVAGLGIDRPLLDGCELTDL